MKYLDDKTALKKKIAWLLQDAKKLGEMPSSIRILVTDDEDDDMDWLVTLSSSLRRCINAGTWGEFWHIPPKMINCPSCCGKGYLVLQD